MARITYVEHDGTEHAIDVPDGLSLMEGAVSNLVPGIDADCGGACACATCMVYVPQEWWDTLPPKAEMEQTMLEFCEHAAHNSRLSCQLKSCPALDGLRLVMPVSQH